VRGTVFVDCASMYRADGDPRFASVGEVEFINGIGAQSASGVYGPVRACAGIVGKVDLTQGASAREVAQACMARASDRCRGIRHIAAWDASPEVSSLLKPPPPHMLMDAKFREGFESNFPVDKGCCSYRVLWNAFKRMAAGYSESEKADMFAGSAYRAT
jgi:hypothetical protein